MRKATLRWVELGSIVLLLALFWGRVLVNARDQSPTMDEPFHLVRGAAYWLAGDLRLQYEHPPLIHALGGAFLALEPGLPSPASAPGWEHAYPLDVAEHFLWEPAWSLDRALFLSRWPGAALGLVLSALVYRWARELFGRGSGAVALLLCTLDPNLLAHASLLTTDLAAACTAFAACYTFWRWLGRPTGERRLPAGLALGLALGAKLSTLILLPVFGLALLWHAWRERVRLWSLLGGFAAILSAALLVLWGLYRFEMGPWSPIKTWVPMPTYLNTLEQLWQHQSAGQRAFFLGQVSEEGWWLYFPVVFAIKTPVSLLLLMIAAAVAAWRARPSRWPAVALIFPVAYFAVSMASRINIGYRHILPVVPFAVLGAASVFRLRHPRWRAALLGGLLLWAALASVWIHPYYLAYFNELVGGPNQGYRYVVDSNLDWGQDLKRLKWYLDEQGIDRVRLSYFGRARPEWYGINYDPLPTPLQSSPADFSPFNPQAGVYAIGASSLQLMEDPDIFDWFRRHRPTAKVGYSIFVYDVADRGGEDWAAVCYAPVAALEADQIRGALGRPDLRLVYFDCRTAWVYPAGAAPGWYVIPDDAEGPTLVPAYLDEAQIVYRSRRTGEHMGLTVYREEGAESQRAQLRVQETSFGHVAHFLGYAVETSDDAVTLRTYWEALGPSSLPLSVMAHLVDAQGAKVAVGDGLSFLPGYWQEGDVFIQHHTFARPTGQDLDGYAFNVGLYRVDTLERVPPAGSEEDYLVLSAQPDSQSDLPGNRE